MESMNGLWTVIFQSNFQTVGTGVAVIINERILGGDSHYYYDGRATVTGNVIEAIINVVRYNKAGMAIFGNLDSYNLKVSGEVAVQDLVLQGNMVEQPNMRITIKCKKIASA